MKVGLGYCEEESPFSAGQTIAKNAVKDGDMEKIDLILVFSHGYEDIQVMLKGIRSVAGEKTTVAGGSVSGIISNNIIRYKGKAALAAAVETGDSFRFQFGQAMLHDDDDINTGIRLAQNFKRGKDDRLLFILFDIIKHAEADLGSKLASSSKILNGIGEKIGTDIPITGAGLSKNLRFNPSTLFCGDRVLEHTITGLMISGRIRPYIGLTHGQIPLDGVYHRVTRAEGHNLYELDGTPVPEIIDELYGSSNWRDQLPVRMLSVGSNYGNRFGNIRDAAYVSKVILGMTPDGEGISLSDSGLKEGDEIQFMLRDVTRIIKSTKKTAEGLIEKIYADNKRPFMGIYLDCGGRTADFLNSEKEEAREVQKVFNTHKIPLIGLYSGSEIAPMVGNNRGMSWTGVITILAGD